MEVLTENELIAFIDDLVYKKVESNEDFIKFSFYEVRVKGNVIEQQEDEFLTLAKNKLTNMGYSVYLGGEEFMYKNSKMKVEPNELLIAIKEK